jgi:[acyl-carrier-protein] S-malonyltransferase
MTINPNLACVFPGQGSQQIGMLADIASVKPEILATFAEASDILGYDLWQLIQAGQQEDLNLTEKAQPALLASSVAIWRLLRNANAPLPAFLAGHSLGEWSALVCGGVLAFTDAIRLVQLRGRYMQEAVPPGVGAMAAVLGLSDELTESCCAQAAQAEVVVAVNFNSPGQVVIAGHQAAVDRAIELCKTAGAKRAIPLPVSAPFHTPLMQGAAERLAEHILTTEFRTPQIPVVHNCSAATESNPEVIRQLMIQQIYSPVPWVACMNTLMAKGVTSVLEVGPGKVLAGLCKRINKDLAAQTTDTAEAIQQLTASNTSNT